LGIILVITYLILHLFTLEVFMENGTVHNPSIITSEVVMETDNPPNN
jgi:hypothetical protein